MTKKAQQEINHKLKVLSYASTTGNISRCCRFFGISRNTFYRWKKKYEAKGESGLANGKPCPENLKMRVAVEIEEKILYLRKEYHFGPRKISYYLKMYLQMVVSPSGVYSVLKRNGLQKLPIKLRKRHAATDYTLSKADAGSSHPS